MKNINIKKILNKWFEIKNINIEQVINKWFEMKLKTYDRLEYEDSIYFYYEGEDYAKIRIDKKNERIFYDKEIYEEFSMILPKQYSDFKQVMSEWVGDTFGLMGFAPVTITDLNLNLYTTGRYLLKIPLV